VYASVIERGEPAISDVLITIEQADGSHSSAMNNSAGFYIVSGTAGTSRSARRAKDSIPAGSTWSVTSC
jgi:hypothetical protein